MITGGRSVVGDILSQGVPEEISALNILFDTKNYQRMKMISEIPPALIYVLTVLGTIQKRYHSTVLETFDKEFLARQKSRDRKGIVELIEVMLGLRKIAEGEEE